MTAQNDFAKMFGSIPNLCNPDLAKGGMASVAEYNTKLGDVALEAAEKSTEVMTAATKTTLDNMRDLTSAREPSAYAQAFAGFMQAQMELTQSATTALFEVAQGAGAQMGAVSASAAESAETTVKKTTNAASARKRASATA
ncbi:phasin family protein [Salipiger sp. PrR002]|uniref:phasin family protein n=1 Tax=Salipiger sp. PrR002 TaxID=2706489 RepID=UPI0013BD21B3|nr:phasin family protein [Salipiger sp. PrR002]NDW01869.1 hypothetical protein [Salipiger sp. PrR002]NDW59101.1 hypothetical protein [Salipiger sp. PrR004]